MRDSIHKKANVTILKVNVDNLIVDQNNYKIRPRIKKINLQFYFSYKLFFFKIKWFLKKNFIQIV